MGDPASGTNPVWHPLSIRKRFNCTSKSFLDGFCPWRRGWEKDLLRTDNKKSSDRAALALL
jgi:hypothetical protein